MILTVHIDNRVITLAVYDGEKQRVSTSVGTDLCGTSDQYAAVLYAVLGFSGIDTDTLEGAVISSVVPSLTPVLRRAVERLCGHAPLVVGAGIKTGLNLRLDSVGTVGSDFICNAVAALQEFKPPLVVIHLTNATTFAAIDDKGVFIGRSILPGVESSLEHLCKSSAQLPDVSFDTDAALLGKNTADAIRSGILYSSLCLLEGMFNRYQQALGGQAQGIVTGTELAQILCERCAEPLLYRPQLLHDGLRLLYAKNRKNT